jgi:tetratricopeptide (TPR) repeat protein
MFSLETFSAQSSGAKVAGIQDHMQLAQAALKANDMATAAKEFHNVLALDPGNVEANVNLGVIAFSQDDCQTSSRLLRKTLARRPSIPQAQAILGICEKRLGDRSAQALLESSFSELTDVKLRTQVGMELVGLYYQQGASERAIPVVQKLVDINPDDTDILYMAQRLYGELAEDTLNKLAVLAPGSARMQQVIAERLVNTGNLKEAIEHYKKALEINPHLPGMHYELAQAILELSPADSTAQAESEKELQTAIATEGDSARVQCQLGRIALLRSDSVDARVHYERAFSLDSGDPEAQLGLGRTLMTLGRIDDAKKYLEMAVKSDPLNGTAHYRLALAYKRLQMADAAEKEMHLFHEIQQTKEQVKALYHEMNSQPQSQADEGLENDQ